MRNLAILAVLGLAACGENAGWNPNYSAMHNGSPYAEYLQAREVALHGRGPVPDAIPVQLPVQAPTAADIAGTPAKRPVAVRPAADAATRPAAVPAGVQAAAPSLVRYARQERQAPGTRKYQRSGSVTAAAAAACRNYGSADVAQSAFIAAGGPVIDPRGLDPDGDGFACGWDPRPLRRSGP
ncbi:hypothetical protein [Paracoccus thiocyanatus]|uniref:Excalibur calcium-binding domain-containing protein n=1 Tax=Paracoccus thiocyanatus TaxID=34006 RepID=A0A3D8PCL7_9RHOB|nr:hypothetical protein [Paracoccus thiocyanatus]RDW12965.1 hypothetical protein DIE28_10775 [Paracoccus thiocyanatus]